jgi:hypothetical protein
MPLGGLTGALEPPKDAVLLFVFERSLTEPFGLEVVAQWGG